MTRIFSFCLLVLLFSTVSARAEESFRIPRPTQSLLGELIYPGMRTPLARSSFESWRQGYCDPFVCNMVLCHGSCAQFAEHCPSFSESARVIHLGQPGCLEPQAVSVAASHCAQK
jgi:hypothetical protein